MKIKYADMFVTGIVAKSFPDIGCRSESRILLQRAKDSHEDSILVCNEDFGFMVKTEEIMQLLNKPLKEDF